MDAWTPHASFRLLASILQNASLDLVNCQKAEGARARATRAGATRFIIAVARHRPKQQSSQPLAPATAFASSLRVLLRADAARRRALGPTTPSRRSDFCKLSAQRARKRTLRKNGAPPRARRNNDAEPPPSPGGGRGALSESAQSGTSKRRRRASSSSPTERRSRRRRRALPFITKTIGLRDRRHGELRTRGGRHALVRVWCRRVNVETTSLHE